MQQNKTCDLPLCPLAMTGLALLLLPSGQVATSTYIVAAKAYDGTNCQGALSTGDLFGFANPLDVTDSECVPVAGVSLRVSCTTGFPRLQLFSGSTCTGSIHIDFGATDNGCVYPTHSFQPDGNSAAAVRCRR